MNEITIKRNREKIAQNMHEDISFQYFEKLPVSQLLLIVFQIFKVNIRIY